MTKEMMTKAEVILQTMFYDCMNDASHTQYHVNELNNAFFALRDLGNEMNGIDNEVSDALLFVADILQAVGQRADEGYLYELEEVEQKTSADEAEVDWEDVYGVEGYAFVDLYGNIH